MENTCNHKLVIMDIESLSNEGRKVGECVDCYSAVVIDKKYSPIKDNLYRKKDNLNTAETERNHEYAGDIRLCIEAGNSC